MATRGYLTATPLPAHDGQPSTRAAIQRAGPVTFAVKEPAYQHAIHHVARTKPALPTGNACSQSQPFRRVKLTQAGRAVPPHPDRPTLERHAGVYTLELVEA